MKIKITAIRSKDITWSGGVFKKYEVKTETTGPEILELRFGKRGEKVKVGDIVEGYIEKNIGKDGKEYGRQVCAITADYVYKLLLKISPDVESTEQNVLAPPLSNTGFSDPEPDEKLEIQM